MLPQDKPAFFGHLRQILAKVGCGDEKSAARVIRAVLDLQLANEYPDLRKLGLRAGAKPTRQPELVAFSTWLSGQEFLHKTFWLSSAYAHLLPKARRSAQALFFTPPLLATRLITSLTKRGVDLATARVVDPSCGGSAFLAPVAIEMAKLLKAAGSSHGEIIRHVETHVSGFEIDPLLCELSHVFLNMALYEHVRNARRLLEDPVIRGDALVEALAHTNSTDVVITNPPYRKLTAEEFAQLPNSYQHLVKGQPNLYTLFIDLSLRLTRAGGHLGLLTPAGFFGGRSFGPLRNQLFNQASVDQVDFIEPRIGTFLNVEQETALTVLRKGVHQHALASVSVTEDGRDYTALGDFSAPVAPSAPWVLPRNKQDIDAVSQFSGYQLTLAAYGYEAKTGYLVPHRMPVPCQKKRGRGKSIYPLIWATQIGKDGIHRHEAGLGKHAALYVKTSVHGKTGVIRVPGVAVQRTSSKDQMRRLRCAPIPHTFVKTHGGYMGENHVCFLLPIAGQPPTVSVTLLAAILNSAAVDRAFRCLSGTATVSVYELAALPLPEPNAVQLALSRGDGLEQAVRKGYAAVHNAKAKKAA